MQQEKDNILKKYAFNKQRYNKIKDRQINEKNQLDQMIMRNSIYGQTDKSFYNPRNTGMR